MCCFVFATLNPPRQIFRVFDINNDGRIEQTELKRIVKVKDKRSPEDHCALRQIVLKLEIWNTLKFVCECMHAW